MALWCKDGSGEVGIGQKMMLQNCVRVSYASARKK